MHKKEKVVVVIILYQSTLTAYEEVSLRQCFKVLKQHPISIVKPEGLHLNSEVFSAFDFKIENFPDNWFKDIGTYSRLLVSPHFYKRFDKYEYLLLYQLDAFVFKDELLSWCAREFDYIGAPWFEAFSSSDPNAGFAGGGNGGFSLRKIASHLRVVQKLSYINPPAANLSNRMRKASSLKSFVRQAIGFLLDMTIRNNTFWPLNSFKGFEDQFWCLTAANNFKWFRIPDWKVGIQFAMEMQPRRVYEVNNENLPFGCHAWWKYDLEFWKPHIEKFGYRI